MSYADNFKKMKPGLDFGQAVAEADRCLLCHEPPCSTACPANTQPGTFIRKLRMKNITGAIRTIKENNILGGACGVLCPTARLCEKECSATGIGRPIEIGKIQRFLVEQSWERNLNLFDTPNPRNEKIAVVGSGPGGLSCAAELAKKGFPVTVFEARPEPGGVLRYGVVSYRFDLDFLEKELGDVKSLGVEFKCNTRIEGDRGAEKLLENGYSAVFLAPGLWGAMRLAPEKEPSEGLFTSVEYLAALRDGRLEEIASQVEGKTVAVIGGGSVAMDCIESAAKLGAEDVYLVYRRSWMQMPAEEDERIESLEAGVHYLLLNQPTGYRTDEKNRLTGLKMVRTRLGESDDSGRRRPEVIPESEWTLDAVMVIEAIGNRAESDSSRWYPNVDVDDKLLIKADPETGTTSTPGIFAGGDIVRGPALVVNAVQDGKLAAKAIQEYLKE
ncbi:MAG: NAD(P)-dependent oxidoreductase [Desulfobacteraceae bacterium]|nr:NAD(P)-dependent oxidoreductase [Desulfobacteraceae bacterium]